MSTTESDNGSGGGPRTHLVRERYESKIGHLANIGELGMRSPRVRETLLARDPAEAVFWIDQMIRGAVWGREPDLDALLGLVFWLVRSPRGGEWYAFFQQLYRIAHDHDVQTVLHFLRNAPPHQALSPEAELPDVRLPLDRDDITVGERRTMARTCDRDLIKRLAKDPSPLVLANLLGNPDMRQTEVLKAASRRPTTPELLQAIVEHERWFGRLEVRKALVMNPYDNTGISLKLLPTVGIDALRKVRYGSDLHPILVEAAEYLVDMRETYTSPWEV